MHCLSKQEGEALLPDNDIFKLVKKSLEEQTIFCLTAARQKALADACAMLPAIFQRGLTVRIVTGAFARVHVCPFSYSGQLQLTRNYDKIPEAVEQRIQSQEVWDALVDEASEFHEIRNATFEKLGFPPGEVVGEGKPEDDVRPLNQRRSIIIGNKDKLAKMHQNAKDAMARSKKEKAEAKKAVEAQAAAGARALLLAAELKRLQDFHVKKTKEAEDKTKAEMARRNKAEAEKKEAEKKASAEKKEMEAQIRILTLKLAKAEKKQVRPTGSSGSLPLLTPPCPCMLSAIVVERIFSLPGLFPLCQSSKAAKKRPNRPNGPNGPKQPKQ